MLGPSKDLIDDSADGSPITARDIVSKAQWIPVGNGKYKLTLPSSALIGVDIVPGDVINPDGTDYIIDMNEYDIPEVEIPASTARTDPRWRNEEWGQ